jgi:hypothetical protein
MGQFDVRVFLTHCYVPSLTQMSPDIIIEPFRGIGVMDVVDLIDRYLEEVLKQPLQPVEKKAITPNKIRDEGASAVVTFSSIEASDHIEAIEKTASSLLLCRDILALRQLQRGYVAGFLSMQTDVSPVQLYAQVHRPYPILRKVQNLPIFETEGDILARIADKAQRHPILRAYLSLYADAVAYSDTLVSDISLETRLMKTWTLLETMATSEQGTKKQKVKALFTHYQTSAYLNYRGHQGQDLLDIAYKWRNIIVHCGGCSAATQPGDIRFCQDFQPEFEHILEDLNQSCRGLLHAFAHSLP